MRFLIAALALALSSAALAQEGAPWRAVDAATGQIGDVEGLAALAEAFPDSASVRLRLLNAQLEQGDFGEVVASLRWLHDRGYVFSEGARSQIPQLVGQEHAGEAGALLLPDAEPLGASEVVATIPAEAGLIESVLVPEGQQLMVVTSVTGKAIHILDAEQVLHSYPIPGASDLSGVVSEPDDSIGWAASANLDESEDAEPLFTGLMGLRGDFQNPVLVPAPENAKAVSDLAVAADATVYASDPLGGGVYRKPIGAVALEELVAPGTLRSPQGLAVSADQTRLYVSDYRYGLAIIDLASGAVSRLASDIPVILDGIDGLWLHQGELIAMQNGTSPMRISAFALSEDGTRITAVRTLEQAHPGWTEPLGGSISNGALFYVATGQWDRYRQGQPVEGKAALPTEIRRLPLGLLPD